MSGRQRSWSWTASALSSALAFRSRRSSHGAERRISLIECTDRVSIVAISKSLQECCYFPWSLGCCRDLRGARCGECSLLHMDFTRRTVCKSPCFSRVHVVQLGQNWIAAVVAQRALAGGCEGHRRGHAVVISSFLVSQRGYAGCLCCLCYVS